MVKRGLTLIELLVAIAIATILSTALFYAFKYLSEAFVQDKAISDLLERARTLEEQLKFYFDRWGNGVPEDKDSGTCDFVFNTNLSDTTFPSSRFCVKVNSSSPCDEVILYGNTQGFLIVLDEKKGENKYNAYACRMDDKSDAYYYVWRGGNVLALTTGNKVGVDGGDCGVNGSIVNASIEKTIKDINGNDIYLQTGDAIIRVPKIIRIYCGTTNGKLYLKVSEKEGDKGSKPSPMVPVKSMHAELLPNGCNSLEGECKAVKFTIEFVNRVRGKEYTLTKEIILGR